MVSLKSAAFETKENTVRDWNDVAEAIASGLAAHGYLPPPGPPAPASVPVPLFIRVRGPDATFLRVVADALEGDILARGGTVARTASGATVVNLDVTVVARGPETTEAVWQAAVVADDQVLMQLSEAVYIRDWDIPLYAKVVSLAPTSSWNPAIPLPVRRVRYDP
jgi:hypothetical protein